MNSWKTKKFKALLLENVHPLAKKVLEAEGVEVVMEKKAFTEKELISVIGEYDLLGIRSKTYLSKNFLSHAKHLQAIGAFCIGTNQIELSSANTLGIPVFNAPYSNTRSVAELVIAEMIALSRQLGDRSQNAHQGIWVKSAAGSREVRGKTLGIVGYGHIGSQLSVLAESFGLRVIFYDVVKKLPLGNAQQKESLNQVLEESDFVSLHVPETDQTKNMFSKNQFQKMKKGSYFINASRGTVVVIADLAEAIRSGHLAGAAVDVFPHEPDSNDEKFVSELQGLPNVLLTPHVGGSTEEAQESIGREVADRFNLFLQNGSTRGAVNFPNVDLPIQQNAHRILNVHQNVPGVLSNINKIVSSHGANIQSQYLSTDSHIGYLVMDFDKKEVSVMADEISKLSTSIKTRVIF